MATNSDSSVTSLVATSSSDVGEKREKGAFDESITSAIEGIRNG